MKTAMQELIDRLDYLIGLSSETMYEFGLKVAKKEAKSMLEKEKEQIMDAYDEGWSDGFDDKDLNSEYYNETFNTK
jgi:hypothetical protein